MHKAVDQNRTLDVMKNAMKNARPVTITYVRADGSETIRTIETYEIKSTKSGDTIIRAMDRESGEPRSWRLDRILFYTVHRASFVVERPVPSVNIQITEKRDTCESASTRASFATVTGSLTQAALRSR